MLHEPVIAAMIILGLIALGEVISIITRARIPMLFIVLIGYLVLVWLGAMPKSLIHDSNFVHIGAVLGTAPIIIHMGTLIPLESIRRQWKAVIISLMGVVFASILVIPIVTILFDYQTAVAGAGPITGGLISTLVTSEGLRNAGLASLVTVATIILAVQPIFSMPIAINFMRRYAVKFRETLEEGKTVGNPDSVHKRDKKKDIILLPEKYQTNLILLFLIFVGSAIAIALGEITPVPYSLWALAVGIIGRLTKVFPERIMEKSSSFSIGMAGILFLIIVQLNDIKFSMFIGYLPEVATIMVLGMLGIFLGGYIGAKIFKWDPLKTIPIALTAMFGFPGDYIVCEEVSRSVGRNKEEERQVMDDILTPMLVGGFTSVTIGSVVVATILVGTL